MKSGQPSSVCLKCRSSAARWPRSQHAFSAAPATLTYLREDHCGVCRPRSPQRLALVDVLVASCSRRARRACHRRWYRARARNAAHKSRQSSRPLRMAPCIERRRSESLAVQRRDQAAARLSPQAGARGQCLSSMASAIAEGLLRTSEDVQSLPPLKLSAKCSRLVEAKSANRSSMTKLRRTSIVATPRLAHPWLRELWLTGASCQLLAPRPPAHPAR